MAQRKWQLFLLLSQTLLVLLGSGAARSLTFEVTINTGTLAGNAGVLAFDLIDGGPPGNTVNLGSITSDGTLVGTSIVGGVAGSGPWTFTDSTFFNELQVGYGPLGSTISFEFSTPDNPPAGGSSPDSFSVFLLNPDTLLSLLSTSDPTGADALFLLSLGSGAAGLEVYRNTDPGVQNFSIQVRESESTSVHEPGSLALLAIGAMAVLMRIRRTPPRTPARSRHH